MYANVVIMKIDSEHYNAVIEDCESLNMNSNRFMKNLSGLEAARIEKFMGQYCHFPRQIISILVSACYTLGFHEWNDVVDELRANITEELGTGYGKISKDFLPHYSILRNAMKEGLDIDIAKIKPDKPTLDFLDNLNTCMDKNPSFVSGALYALEATAIPELSIVFNLSNRLFKLKDLTQPQLLHDFFQFHIDEIEAEHRDRLLIRINEYITDDPKLEEFDRGFNEVINLMNTWWDELYQTI